MSTEAIQKVSREEKLRAMEKLWESLSDEDSQLESPAWHGDALRETEQRYGAGQEQPVDWATAKQGLRDTAVRESMPGKVTAWAIIFSILSLPISTPWGCMLVCTPKFFGYHQLLAQRFPFAVYYKMDEDAYVVWRVLDCRQNPTGVKGALKQGR